MHYLFNSRCPKDIFKITSFLKITEEMKVFWEFFEQLMWANFHNPTSFHFSSLDNVKQLNHNGSIGNIWTLWKIKQKSVVFKLGEFRTMYFRLISIFVHKRINWTKRMAEMKYYEIFYQMNIMMIYQ